MEFKIHVELKCMTIIAQKVRGGIIIKEYKASKLKMKKME